MEGVSSIYHNGEWEETIIQNIRARDPYNPEKEKIIMKRIDIIAMGTLFAMFIIATLVATVYFAQTYLANTAVACCVAVSAFMTMAMTAYLVSRVVKAIASASK